MLFILLFLFLLMMFLSTHTLVQLYMFFIASNYFPVDGIINISTYFFSLLFKVIIVNILRVEFMCLVHLLCKYCRWNVSCKPALIQWLSDSHLSLSSCLVQREREETFHPFISFSLPSLFSLSSPWSSLVLSRSDLTGIYFSPFFLLFSSCSCWSVTLCDFNQKQSHHVSSELVKCTEQVGEVLVYVIHYLLLCNPVLRFFRHFTQMTFKYHLVSCVSSTRESLSYETMNCNWSHLCVHSLARCPHETREMKWWACETK